MYAQEPDSGVRGNVTAVYVARPHPCGMTRDQATKPAFSGVKREVDGLETDRPSHRCLRSLGRRSSRSLLIWY